MQINNYNSYYLEAIKDNYDEIRLSIPRKHSS